MSRGFHEKVGERALAMAVKINHHVATKNRVKFVERRIADQIMRRKNNVFPQKRAEHDKFVVRSIILGKCLRPPRLVDNCAYIPASWTTEKFPRALCPTRHRANPSRKCDSGNINLLRATKWRANKFPRPWNIRPPKNAEMDMSATRAELFPATPDKNRDRETWQ